MTILRRSVTVVHDTTGTYARANVWTAKGYSTKTFRTHAEAKSWEPKQ